MRQLATITALTITLVTVNLVTQKNPTPVNAATKLPLPGSSCCGDVCDCCDQCPCDNPLPVNSNTPKVSTSQPSRKIGDVQYFNGVKNRLNKITDRVGGGWNYHYNPVSEPVTSQPSPAIVTGYYSGTSQWTYPGSISTHLTNDHRLSSDQLMGKSISELEALHDNIHNSTRNVRQILPMKQPVIRQPVMNGGCPNGVCPTQPRTSLFGRWR